MLGQLHWPAAVRRNGLTPLARVRNERVQSARVVSHVRWAGVVLGITQALLTTNPKPVLGWLGVAAASIVMAGYNVPAAFIHRVPRRYVEPIVLTGLIGDFLVV